jgi:hypothetical protein
VYCKKIISAIFIVFKEENSLSGDGLATAQGLIAGSATKPDSYVGALVRHLGTI